MSKLTILLSIAIVYFCWIATDRVESSRMMGANNNMALAASPKTARIISPSVAKLYRLLRGKGLTNGEGDDLNTEDDNYFKKRGYDDYGHMRFGKRGPTMKDFDDYGHMRFGK